MKANLKQHGGDMKKCAECYREQKGGHYATRDGKLARGDKQKYSGHTHTPGSNPAVTDADSDSDSEPESTPQAPTKRITRNMPDREKRRLGRQDGSGLEQDGEGFMDWLRKHPITEDIALGALGAVATVATGGLADAVAGPAMAGMSALGDAAEDTLGKDTISAARSAAKSAYGHMPARTKVAEGILTDAGATVFEDSEKDVAAPDAPAVVPPAVSNTSQADQYNANYNALYGHVHEAPFTGSIWG